MAVIVGFYLLQGVLVIVQKLVRRWFAASSQGLGPARQSPIALDAVVRETSSDQAVKIMVAEAADLTRGMRELLMTCDRYVYFGGLVAAAALTVGIARHDSGYSWLVLVFAPYALGLTFIYLMQIFTEIERRAGYLRFLEETIRQLIETPALFYSDVNGWHARSRLSTLGAQFLNGLALLALVLLSVSETRRYSRDGPELLGVAALNFHYLNMLLLSMTLLTIIAAVRENARESDRAYKAAADGYGRHRHQLKRAP
jgi:hypothetical protein